jgi:hypothetical protein
MATWHPILAAQEIEPGFWRMIDPSGVAYGEIRLVRRGREIGYRAESVRGDWVGYYTTLRASTRGVHMAFVRSHGAGDFQGYPTAEY